MYFSDIWIVGDCLISQADFWASSASRMNLKLDPNQAKVRWLRSGSMKWQHLRSQVQWVGLHGQPRIIILHVGGNNVVDIKMQKMKRIMKRDFNNLFKTFPNTLIKWSEILPRLTWKYALSNSHG